MNKCLLIILDGYGIAPMGKYNAVTTAKTPNLDRIFTDFPTGEICASGLEVGLPEGQMGNSEVGHLNMGAGRVVYQELTRISKAIEEGDFFDNEALCAACENAKHNNSALHIMGLTSDGGVHSSKKHYEALLKLAKIKGVTKVYFHCFTDGRDTPPESALEYIKQLDECIERSGLGRIASVCGRYYSMDRDNRAERTKLCYDMLLNGEGERFFSAESAIASSYEKGVTDEFIMPCVIAQEGDEPVVIKKEDSVIFFNFRADRARQITRALTQDEFSLFARDCILKPFYVCMTEYEADFTGVHVAFPPHTMKNTLGEYLSNLKLKQLRIAETEKYAHVTYFFNGGCEQPYPGEERVLIPSPKVATYDLKPEMSAYEVCEKLIERLETKEYDFLAVNFANCDMVGHTGVFEAAVKAVEAVDECVGKLVNAAINAGYKIFLTADHGNAEKMAEEDGSIYTAHTTNKVRTVVIGADEVKALRAGSLCDVAPSILELMGINKPVEMSGESLLIK